MSVQRCQQETTSTEFLDWIEYLERDVNAFHREDYFLASIAREICQVREMFAKKPRNIKLESFLQKFVFKKEKIMKPLTKEETTERAKRKFLSWAGIGVKKKKR